MEDVQAALAVDEFQKMDTMQTESIWKVTKRFLSGKSSVHDVNVYSYPPKSLNPRANPITKSLQPATIHAPPS